MKYFVRPSIRMQSAVLTGMGGGATAQAMGLWGGDLARFLPPTMAFDLGGCFWCRLCGRCAGQCAGTQRPAWYGNVYPCMASRHFAGRVHRRFAVWAIGFRCALRRGPCSWLCYDGGRALGSAGSLRWGNEQLVRRSRMGPVGGTGSCHFACRKTGIYLKFRLSLI